MTKNLLFPSTVLAALALAAAAAFGAPAGEKPGVMPQTEATEPEGLKALLPPFTEMSVVPPAASEGWSPLMISPNGKFFLGERTRGGRRSVHLFDENAMLFRGLGSSACRWSSARWGQSDWTFFLECRPTATGKPEYKKVDRVSEKETPSRINGLARWTAKGDDFYLPVTPTPKTPGAPRFQRYTSANKPVGIPLATDEPAWSADSTLLAFVTRRPRPADVPEKEWSPVGEVRVIPARGDVARVVLSRGSWTKLMEERGWKWASGPDNVAWSPTGDALFGVVTVRTGSEEQRYLMRIDLKEPRREFQLVDETTHLVSASADGKHWLIEMDSGAYRLDFDAKK
jgi:hypothetical protein